MKCQSIPTLNRIKKLYQSLNKCLKKSNEMGNSVYIKCETNKSGKTP